MTPQELTHHVLESIFAPAGNWQHFANLAAQRRRRGEPLLTQDEWAEIRAESLYPELLGQFVEKYLASAQPLEAQDALLAQQMIADDFFGWPRHRICDQPEGRKHLSAMDALKLLHNSHSPVN